MGPFCENGQSLFYIAKDKEKLFEIDSHTEPSESRRPAATPLSSSVTVALA